MFNWIFWGKRKLKQIKLRASSEFNIKYAKTLHIVFFIIATK